MGAIWDRIIKHPEGVFQMLIESHHLLGGLLSGKRWIFLDQRNYPPEICDNILPEMQNKLKYTSP